MEAEVILDRFNDREIADLERYYLHTIAKADVRHDPLRVASLLIRLTVAERLCLSEWAYRNFQPLVRRPGRQAA